MKLGKLSVGKFVGLWFFVFLFAFGGLRSEYSHATNAVSELGGIGTPFSIFWNICGFLGTGLLIVAFGWGLHERLKQNSIASTGGLAVMLLGFLIGATAIPADFNLMFRSPWTKAHAIFVLLGPLPFVWAVIVWTRDLQRLAATRKVVMLTLGAGLLIVPAFALYRVLPDTPGLVQRLVFGAMFTWLFALSVAVTNCPRPKVA